MFFKIIKDAININFMINIRFYEPYLSMDLIKNEITLWHDMTYEFNIITS